MLLLVRHRAPVKHFDTLVALPAGTRSHAFPLKNCIEFICNRDPISYLLKGMAKHAQLPDSSLHINGNHIHLLNLSVESINS